MEGENDRLVDTTFYRVAVRNDRFPFTALFDHAHRFFAEAAFRRAACSLDITDLSVRVNDEFHDYRSLNAVVAGVERIVEVQVEIVEESVFAAAIFSVDVDVGIHGVRGCLLRGAVDCDNKKENG